MKTKAGGWKSGCALFAAGLVALAMTGCSDGSSSDLAIEPNIQADEPVDPAPQDDPVIIPDPAPAPTPASDPSPVSESAAALVIERNFEIQVDPPAAFSGAATAVTVSTSDFEPSDPDELADDMVKDVTVMFGGKKVPSTSEIGRSADGSRAQIKAIFSVPGDVPIGRKKVILMVNGVASQTKEFRVRVLFASLPPGKYVGTLLPKIIPGWVSRDDPADPGAQSAGDAAPSASDSNTSGEPGVAQVSPPPPMNIAAGEKHTCATKGNRVSCWGNNEHRQLGGWSECLTLSGTGQEYCSTFSSKPVPVLEGDVSARKPFEASKVVKLAAGANHTCALKADNTVWCWGSNSRGQLGGGFVRDGEHATQCAPNQYDSTIYPSSFGAVQVVMDRDLSNEALPTEPLTGVVDIAASGDRTCARTQDGKLFCWGYRERLCYYRSNSCTDSVCAAVPVHKPVGEGDRPELTPLGNVEELAVGDDIFIRQTGKSTILRLKWERLSGLESDPRSYAVSEIAGTPGLSRLAAKGEVLCAIDGDGAAYCGGERNGSVVLSPLSMGSVSSIAVGETDARKYTGICVVSGNEDQLDCRYYGGGALGNSTIIDSLKGAKSIAVGFGYACSVDGANTVKCGGDLCNEGQCGRYHSGGRMSAQEVEFKP